MLVLAVSAFVCVALIGAVQLRSHVDEIAAAKEGEGFAAPPLATETPGASGPDQIVVLGDEWAQPRNTVDNRPWTYVLERRLGVRVRALASDGGAWAPSAVGAGGAPFGAATGQIPPTATIVAFFGGARDVDDDPAELAASVTQALADAAREAPLARRVVIAPVPTRPGESARLTEVRRVLRIAAATSRADFVDPVAGRWMNAASLYDRTEPAPSQAGNVRLADRIGAALTPLLNRASG